MHVIFNKGYVRYGLPMEYFQMRSCLQGWRQSWPLFMLLNNNALHVKLYSLHAVIGTKEILLLRGLAVCHPVMEVIIDDIMHACGLCDRSLCLSSSSILRHRFLGEFNYHKWQNKTDLESTTLTQRLEIQLQMLGRCCPQSPVCMHSNNTHNTTRGIYIYTVCALQSS